MLRKRRRPRPYGGPLVDKAAVREYLGRRVDDWRWVKELSREDLFDELAAAAPGFVFKKNPWRHQLACVFLGVCLPRFLFFLHMSAGKTKIALDIVSIRRHLGEIDRPALVLVRNEAACAEWASQAEEFTDLRTAVLVGSSKEKMRTLEGSDADLVVTHYPGLVAMVKSWSPSRLRRFARGFGALVLDEVHTCKNSSSRTFRVCRAISAAVPYCYGLTGTPVGADPMDFWAEFKVVDGGETLGTKTLFRAAFFSPREGYQGRLEWHFLEGKRKDLWRLMRHRSIIYADDEIGELPAVVEQKVRVPATKEIERWYSPAQRAFYAAKDRIELDTCYARIRQLLSGLLYAKDEDGGPRAAVRLPCAKLEWLETLLEEAAGEKVVVFHEFIESGRRIEEALTRLGVKWLSLRGETKDKGTVRKRFESGDYRVLVANLATGGQSLNLQAASRVVFYELPSSLITFQQALCRCVRKGQKAGRVYIHYLVTKGTLEESVLSALKSGEEFLDAFRKSGRGKAR